MPLVMIDSNVADEIAKALTLDADLVAAMEAQESPPLPLTARGYAWFWLLAIAPTWRSCVYTCSRQALREISRIPDEKAALRSRLLGLVFDLESAHRTRTEDDSPGRDAATLSGLTRLGFSLPDATYLVDATNTQASHFLTYDKGILSRSEVVLRRWGIRVQTPEAFLLQAVRDGAPWPASVPWPWEAGPVAEPFGAGTSPTV